MQQDGGYVKLYRSLRTRGHLRAMPEAAFRLFIIFLLAAEWREGAPLPPGCLEMSYAEMQEETGGFGRSRISAALEWLEHPPPPANGPYIQRQAKKGVKLRIRIVNWPLYQSHDGTTPPDQSHSGTTASPMAGLPPVPQRDYPPATSLNLGLPKSEFRTTSPSLSPDPPLSLGTEEVKNNDDHREKAGADEAQDPMTEVGRYVAARTRGLVVGPMDEVEIRRWLQQTGGNVEVIKAGIDAGLQVFQADNPGDYPRKASFYSGFVEKQWQRFKALEVNGSGPAGSTGAVGAQAPRAWPKPGRQPARGGAAAKPGTGSRIGDLSAFVQEGDGSPADA